MITVEYLLPFNTKDGICRNITSFNSLLASHSDISITEKKLRYKNSNYSYNVTMNKVSNQDCTVFHVTFEISTVTEKFREMLKSFKKTVGVHVKDDIQIIWDGIGFEWSKELYPRIYQIENLMRKLISKFMLINLGVGWYKSAIPLEVKDSIKSPKAKTSLGILYEVDFIQLSNFLFKQYAIKDSSKLPEILANALEGDLTVEKREEILEFIPKNNWDRYISKIVDCESEQLQKKWTRLYEIRCMVAHNNSLLYEDFKSGLELCDYLEPILQKAFDSLDNVEIPANEIENISLNTIATVHEPTKAFITDYHNFSTGITDIINQNKGVFDQMKQYTNSPISAILDYSSHGLLHISDSLKSTLGTIESTKLNLLSSESFATLNNYTDNSHKLFIDASTGFVTGIDGLKITSAMPNYLTDNMTLNIGKDILNTDK
jgi:hypothetical protein